MDALRVAAHRLALADQSLTEQYPVLYPNAKLMALSLLLYRLIHIASFFSIINNVEPSVELGHPPNLLPPLFNSSSSITDVSNGSTHHLLQLIGGNDIAIVLYYAPWCVHSRSTATRMETIAEQFSDEVGFYAMNCWRGECREREGAMMYPQVAVFHRHLYGALQYYGPRTVYSMTLFIERLTRPLIVITSSTQLHQLLREEESVAVAHINMSGDDGGSYLSYYHASFFALQTDPLTSLHAAPSFAIVTNPRLASSLTLPPPPSLVMLHMGGARKVYNEAFEPKKIYKWTKKECNNVVKQLVPSGYLPQLGSSPSVILFLPLNNDQLTRNLLTEYRRAALLHRRAVLNSLHPCHNLGHLKHLSCVHHSVSNQLQSLPLCSSSPHSLCPIYSPFYRHHSPVHCQESADLMAGGWPPPCYPVRYQFWYVDSSLYGALSVSMGVSPGTNTSLVVLDTKSSLQFSLPVTLSSTAADIGDMVDTVAMGGATLLRRNSGSIKCTPSPSSPCVWEVTASSFNDAVLHSTSHTLLVHYAPWCGVCVSVWPVLYALSHRYSNTTQLHLARLNGATNDIPSCHLPLRYPSVVLYHSNRKHSPIWYPVSRPITIEYLSEFIQQHTGLVPDSDTVEDERGVVRGEWEEMGWRLWQYSEKERQKLEADNRQLAERLNKIAEERAAASRLVTEDNGDVMAQLETLLKNVLADENRLIVPTSSPAGEEESTTPTAPSPLAAGEESTTPTALPSSEVVSNVTTSQCTVSRT